VVAGLLHDVVEDTDWSTTQLCARFGETVSQIVDGVTDVDYHHHASSPGSSSSSSSDGASPMTKAEAKAAQDAANQQRLLLAMGGSLNVVLVKLADRVHNMRTLGAMPAEKRVKKAKVRRHFLLHLSS
jgi:(p)ppGpp synthase/HD superfamily hydrolase